MRRYLPLAVVLLLLSGVMQIAVCWTIAIRTPNQWIFGRSTGELWDLEYLEVDPDDWHIAVPGMETRPELEMQEPMFGWAVGSQETDPDDSGIGYQVVNYDYGFPLPSVSHYFLDAFHWEGDTPDLTGIPEGYHFAWVVNEDPLPLFIHPLPFAINWLIYFTVLSAPVAGWVWVRRWRRVRRGRCASCGYDLRGLGGGTCPECGGRASVETA